MVFRGSVPLGSSVPFPVPFSTPPDDRMAIAIGVSRSCLLHTSITSLWAGKMEKGGQPMAFEAAALDNGAAWFNQVGNPVNAADGGARGDGNPGLA